MKKLNFIERFFLGGTIGTFSLIISYFINNLLINNYSPIIIKYFLILLQNFIFWGLLFSFFYNFFYKKYEKNEKNSIEESIKKMHILGRITSLAIIILIVILLISLFKYDFFVTGIIGLAILAFLLGFIGSSLMKKKLEKDINEINKKL